MQHKQSDTYIQTSPTQANKSFRIYICMILKWAVRMKCVCVHWWKAQCKLVCLCVCDATQFEGLINYLKKSKKKSESSRAASTHTNPLYSTHTCCSDSPSPARAEIVHSSSPTWIINLDCMCMHVYMPTECVCVCAGTVKWDVEKEPPLSAQTPDPTSERRKKREMLRGREINRIVKESGWASQALCKVTNASTILLTKGVQQACINNHNRTQTNKHT